MIRKLLSAAYSLLFAAIVVFVAVIVWKETFGHVWHVFAERHHTASVVEGIEEEMEAEAEMDRSLDELLGEGEQVKLYLGYRVLETSRLEGHFHHIDMTVQPDRRSQCVTCHGDLPHDKVPEVRAFWNMHTFLLACETCHVRLPAAASGDDYRWYDLESGALIDDPAVGTRPVPYTAKIVPMERVDGSLRRVDSQERLDRAAAFAEEEGTLSQEREDAEIDGLHEHLAEEPHVCDDCHGAEPLLPLEDLGYPQNRIESILGTEVIDMLEEYKTFYMFEVEGTPRRQPGGTPGGLTPALPGLNLQTPIDDPPPGDEPTGQPVEEPSAD
jgi:hypothetical protein